MCAPRRWEVSLDNGLAGPLACGGVEDGHDGVGSDALVGALNDDAAVVDYGGSVCAGGRREVVDCLGMCPLSRKDS
jgi:hypothetical protein